MKNHLQRTRITKMTQYILINIFRILGLGEKSNHTPAERRAQARNMSSQFLIDQKIITKNIIHTNFIWQPIFKIGDLTYQGIPIMPSMWHQLIFCQSKVIP